MKKTVFMFALVLLAVTVGLRAGEVCKGCSDPEGNKWKVTSIKWIKANEDDLDKDNKFVALVGKVTKQHDSDTYFFTDGTGTIELDSDIKLPVGETIVVRGRIDQAFLHIGPLEVNVDSWRHGGKEGEWLK